MSDKTEKTVSQVQQTHARLAGEAKQAWQKMIDDQVGRADAFYAELGKMDTKGVEQANSMVDEMTKISRESLSYFVQLNAEWRNLTLEAMKKTADLVTLGR